MNIKFRSLGQNAESLYGIPTSAESKKIYYPEIRLNLEAVPELAGADVGDEIEISFEGCIISMTKSETDNSVRLELTSCSVGNVGKPRPEQKEVEEPVNEADVALNTVKGYNPRY